MIRSFRLLVLALLPLLAIAPLEPVAALSPSASPAAVAAIRKAPNDPNPTLITLHYTDADPAIVLQDLFTQFNCPYEIFPFESSPASPRKWPRLTINADAQPFWQVMTTIDNSLGTYTVMSGAKMRVSLYRPGRLLIDGPRCISGPCAFIADTIHNRIDFTDPDHTPNCAVDIVCLPEPRLPIATFPSRSQPDLALDENGHSLLCDPAPPFISVKSSHDLIKFQIDLDRPAGCGQRIAEIKGYAHIMIVDQVQSLEFSADDFAQGKIFDLDGATLTLLPIRKDNIAYYLKLEAEPGTQSPAQWESTTALLDSINITLLDENDAPLYATGIAHGGNGSDLRTIDRNFSRYQNYNKSQLVAGPPVKGRITYPRLLDLKIPYEFKNLPLP